MPRPIPTEEQQDEFLSLIADGKTRQEAAEAIEGTTSTMWRTFINGTRPESVAFAERYLEALTNAGNAPSPLAQDIKEREAVHLAHRLFDEYLMRALDSERGKVGASNRMLYNLGLLNIESFKPLLEARVRHVHSGAVGLYAALPQIDTSRWTLEEQEEFVALEERRNLLLQKATPDGQRSPVQAIGSGEDPPPAGPPEDGAGVREPRDPLPDSGEAGAEPDVIDADYEELEAAAG